MPYMGSFRGIDFDQDGDADFIDDNLLDELDEMEELEDLEDELDDPDDFDDDDFDDEDYDGDEFDDDADEDDVDTCSIDDLSHRIVIGREHGNLLAALFHFKEAMRGHFSRIVN